MKTFEERYTAWIDGQLEGSTLTAFEQELARRAAAGEAEADRDGALRLRHLLRGHLEAPPLGNAEFFSHQLRERLDREMSAYGRPEGARSRGGGKLIGWLPWSFGRFAMAGALCLFVAGAVYYGLEPGGPEAGKTVAKVQAPTTVTTPANQAVPAVHEEAPTAVAQAPRDPSDRTQLALASPTPAPLIDLATDIQVKGESSGTATPLHYQQPNVNVLWTNGLEYQPDVPGTSPAAVPAVPPTIDAPAPAAGSAAP